MKFASIGSPVESRSLNNSRRGQSGFTLFEALAALTILVIFAATLGPFLFQARHIMANADGRLAAQDLLRSLLEDPLNRPSLANPLREGQSGGLQWRLVAQPMVVDPGIPLERPKWLTFHIIARVSWGPGQAVTAETVRLGKAE
jgi:prepilin-type N-terminal cleavage/methylation domain-containing protein